jgi:ubiquinone/menaquinone biosynthesis C-methylase UbiE
VNFREFEHAGWEKATARYDEAFGRLTTQCIEPLLDAVSAGRGVKLLDVASGPGYVAGAAAKRGAIVVGTDFAQAMVAEARRRYPTIRFQEADAEALPFPDAAFDAVTMNFGLLHLGRPEQAIAQVHRILREGGRFAFSVWARPEEARAYGIVLDAIGRHGNLKIDLPPGPPFFRFSDAEECRRVLANSGFREVNVKTVPQTWRLESPAALFDTIFGATVRTGALLRAQTPQALAAIRAEVTAQATTELPMPAVLASATKGPSSISSPRRSRMRG